ncbi:MAG: FapA family protein [Lachnospiraceae bacterium]|nr:FapA family protein [Lachnospiraceae bacterium]
MADEVEYKPKNQVFLRNNNMEAWLKLEAPGEGKEYSYSDIEDILSLNGVVYGLDSSRINAMIKKGIYDREVLVATGKAPEEGKDGYFEFIFDIQKNQKPAIREDGSVDYTSVNVITCVDTNDIIAMYHAAVKGTAGSDVKAKLLPAKPAKDLRPLACTNVEYNPDNMIYRAMIQGRVEVTNSTIKITDVQEFSNDIDNVFGNIDFKGDVIIHGSVKTGVTVTATKSVTVDGTLEGANIVAGTDVIVKGGILGAEKSQVSAHGTVNADFIEYANIHADGDVNANYILDSKVVAKGMVRTTAKTGSIVAGNVYGMMGVETKFAGNDVFIRTVVACGIRDSVSGQRIVYEQQIKTAKEAIKKLIAEEEIIERNIRLGTASEMEVKKKGEMVKSRIEKMAVLNSAQKRYDELTALFDKAKNAMVYVTDTVYGGVVVQVDGQQYTVADEEKRHVQFRKNENGDLEVHPVVNYG